MQFEEDNQSIHSAASVSTATPSLPLDTLVEASDRGGISTSDSTLSVNSGVPTPRRNSMGGILKLPGEARTPRGVRMANELH